MTQDGTQNGGEEIRLDDVRVLLVEDSPDHRLLIEHALKSAGASVQSAQDGQKAIEAVRRSPFDVVLMDIHMPVMDGYHATRTLRSRGCRMPIIALTACAFSEERTRCLAAGCNAHVAKPVARKDLLRAIAAQLRRRSTSHVSPNEHP